MANLPGARQERFTAEETDVLVRAVKDREVALYGDGRNPSKLALVKRAWEEIATIVSTAGIPRTSHRASGAVRTGRAVRNGQLMREQRKHQGAEDPDPLHAVAALLDRTALSGMRQGINARLYRVVMLLRPLRRMASRLQTHHLLLLCPLLLLLQLHLCPPAPLGADRALPLRDPHGYSRHVACLSEGRISSSVQIFSTFFVWFAKMGTASL